MRNYLALMKKVLHTGRKKADTLSLFGETLEFDLRDGFPLVTTRKINYQAVLGELACFLKGETDVKEFRAAGVNFWDADCAKEEWQASEYCKHENDLGHIYGYQWRYGFGFDQLEKLIKDLINNPQSRRHILMTFNPAQIDQGCLPPCFISHQFYSEGRNLDMLVHQRSADLCIGVPFDIASFATLQHIIGQETGLKPRTLKVIFGDVHIYNSHVDKAFLQSWRTPNPLPNIRAKTLSVDTFKPSDILLEHYDPWSSINYKFEVQK